MAERKEERVMKGAPSTAKSNAIENDVSEKKLKIKVGRGRGRGTSASKEEKSLEILMPSETVGLSFSPFMDMVFKCLWCLWFDALHCFLLATEVNHVGHHIVNKNLSSFSRVSVFHFCFFAFCLVFFLFIVEARALQTLMMVFGD